MTNTNMFTQIVDDVKILTQSTYIYKIQFKVLVIRLSLICEHCHFDIIDRSEAPEVRRMVYKLFV